MGWYTVVLLGLAGFLIGGAFSFGRQKRWAGVVILSVAAALALSGAVLWSGEGA